MIASVKSNKVEKYVRQKIVSGGWPAGAKVPSDAELSTELGVSYMTVKTVLSRLAGEGLLNRKRRAGTRVSDGVACGNVGVVFRSESLQGMGTNYYRSMFGHVRDLIEANGYRCILAAGHGETEERFRNSISLFDTVTAKQTVGVICFEGSANLDFCKQMGIPVVYSTSAIPPTNEHCVLLDYEQMLSQGVSLLQEKGYEDFILITMGSPESELDRNYDSQLRRLVHHIPCFADERIAWLPWGGYGCEGIYLSFREWWNGLETKPRALFFMDDAVCDVALRVITELGIQVPKELAILTQSVANRSFHFPVELASLEFCSANVAEVTWRILNDLIDRKDEGKGINLVKIPAEFRTGDSLGR